MFPSFFEVYLTFFYQTCQEIRLGDVDLIRGLFERAISLSLPPKKMKVSKSAELYYGCPWASAELYYGRPFLFCLTCLLSGFAVLI